MSKKYTFDESCEFDGITKEQFLAHLNTWEKEKVNLKIGSLTCKIHPVRQYTCMDVIGKEYTVVLKELLDEFSRGKSHEQGVKNLFKFYHEKFTYERISDIIDYAMTQIVVDIDHVNEGDIPEAKSYREILTREEDVEALMELSKKYKRVHF